MTCLFFFIESRNDLSLLTSEPSSIFSCSFKRSGESLRPVRIDVLQQSASGPPSSELTEINRYCGHLPASFTWPYLALSCYASHGIAGIHRECHTGDTCYLYAHLLRYAIRSNFRDAFWWQKPLSNLVKQWRYRGEDSPGFSTQRYR